MSKSTPRYLRHEVSASLSLKTAPFGRSDPPQMLLRSADEFRQRRAVFFATRLGQPRQEPPTMAATQVLPCSH